MRTEQTVPIQSPVNGKWAAVFVTYKGTPGAEYVANECTSAHVFESAEDAEEGGIRALDILEATGRWPNMCEKF
jgi:hypothetical protein